MEIQEAASLADVVGQYVKLQPRGRNLVGLCPFHPDTTPSFTVSPERGIFYCFGCGAGGTVFSFLMQYHRLSFPEAVAELAKRYGIPLTYKDLGPEGARQTRKRQLFYELHQLARDFYQASLAGPAGKAGRDYLAKRGLSPEVIENYQLGYAPPEWEALKLFLQQKGASLELAQEAGLLVPRARGGWYDRFRDRIMFPILDRGGRVIAFGGRIVGEGEPKYLNSPESPLYSKGRHLFGLPQAAAAIRQHELALVVEGYMDLLALRGHGIEPVVAVLGTALTREQVRLLKSLVSRAVLIFDGDAAGGKAMCRAFPLFVREGLAVRVLPLPTGHDPDSYVRSEGVELFQAPWESAQPWFVYLLEGLIRAYGLDIEGRVRIIGALKPYLAAISEPVEEGLWIKYAAERLGVEETWLRRSLRCQEEIGTVTITAPDHLAISLEQRLLRWILHHPTSLSLTELEQWTQEVQDREVQAILHLILENLRDHGTLDQGLLVHQVEDERIRQKLCAIIMADQQNPAISEECLAADWRRLLRIRHLKKAQQAIKKRLAEAAEGNGEEIMGLLAQRRDIDRQLEALKIQATIKGEDG